jgi:hypothetical protein
MQSELQLVLIVVAIAAAGVSVAYWRHAVVAAMVLLVFEGALRKWALPEAQAAIYLAKDLLLLGAYLGFAMTKGIAAPVARARPFILLLGMSAAYGMIEMLNPALPSLLLAAVGWRAYFFYIPLLFIVPYLFDSQDGLYRALNRYVLLALPIAALGIVQFYSPMDSALNMNVDQGLGEGTVQGFGDDRVRAAGSFSFVSGYGAFLTAAALVVGALLARRDWQFRDNAALYGGLVLIIAAMFATGSRGPVYSLIAVTIVYTIFSAATGDFSFGAAFRACLGAAALSAAVWNFIPEPAEAFHQRVMGTEDTLERLVSPLVEPFYILGEAGPVGFGIGAAHQSAAFLVGSEYSWWTNGMVAEAESSRVMLELGILGFFFVFLFRIAIALTALRAAFALKSRAGRSLALMLALFLGLQIFGAVIFNPTMNVLYWFAVGMLFALYRYEERDAWLARNQQVLPGLQIPGGAGGGRIRNA